MSQPTTTANADAAELAKFQALAAKWWDPNAEFRPLHEINPLRLGWIEAKISLSGRRVLDVGCGGGILAEAMAGRGADVLGIDLAERSLAVAELHALESGAQVRYERVAAEDLAAREPAGFDVVTCMEMLEHVPEPGSILEACARLLKPGGRLFVSTINRTPAAFALAIVGAEYVAGLLPKGTHDYRTFIKPSELTRVLRAVGLEVEDASGLHYDPLRKTAWVAPGTRVNYLLCARKPG